MPTTKPGIQQTAGDFQYYNAAHQSGNLIQGMDVNHNQYPINWTTAFNAGARFVYMKAGGNGFNFHTARYIRVQVNGSSTDGHAVFYELFAKDTSLTERATGATVTGSVAPIAGAWANFTDGNTATSVDLGVGTQYLTVDLGASFNIRYIQVYQTPGVTFHHKLISYSTDNITYTPIFDTDQTGTGEYVEPSDGAQIVTADTASYYGVDAQMLSANIAAARAAGLKVGFYWFRGTNYYDVTAKSWNHTQSDAINEATTFASFISAQLGGIDWGDIIPVLDFENQFGSINPAFTNDQAYTFIHQFISTFKAQTGQPIMLYTAQYTVNTLATTPNQLISGGNAIGSSCPIWLASTDTGTYPTVSYQAFGGFPSNLWSAWQYSSVNGLGATFGVSTTDIDLDWIQSFTDILLLYPSTTSTIFTGFSLYILEQNNQTIPENVVAVMNNKDYASCPFWDAQHYQQVNGESTFTFKCAGNHRDSQYIIINNLVGFYDYDGNFQLFEIVKLSVTHADTLELEVTCEHAAIASMNSAFNGYLVLNNMTASQMLTQVTLAQLGLATSVWTPGNVSFTGTSSMTIDHQSLMTSVYAIAQLFDLEIQFRTVVTNGKITGQLIDLLTRVGADRGKRFVYNRDVVSIEQFIDGTGIQLGLLGYGKALNTAGGQTRVDFSTLELSTANGDFTTKTLGSNIIFTDSTSDITKYSRVSGGIRLGIYSNSSESDPYQLALKTYAAVQRASFPRVEYRMTSVDLEVLTGHSYEKVRIGDTVRVIDTFINPQVEFETRIMELTRNYSEPEKTQIVLDNVTRRSVTQDGSKISNTQSTVINNQGIWQENAFFGNYLVDHSFELLATTSIVMDANGTFPVARPLNTNQQNWFWNNTSAPSTSVTDVNPVPRFFSVYWQQLTGNTYSNQNRLVPSDLQAIVVGTSKRNPKQLVRLSQDGTSGPYCASCYIASFGGTTASGQARIEVWAVGTSNGGTPKRLGTAPVGFAQYALAHASSNWFNWKRIVVPAMTGLPVTTKYLEIALTQPSSRPNIQYLADSVQLSPTNFPVSYQPDSGTWDYQDDISGYSRRTTFINAYPTSVQSLVGATTTVVNYKKLSTQFDTPNFVNGSKINDPLREWSTANSVFVPKHDGLYLFTSSIRWGAGAGGAGGFVTHGLSIGGVHKQRFSYTNVTADVMTHGSVATFIKRGTSVHIYGFSQNATNLASSGTFTYLTIKRQRV